MSCSYVRSATFQTNNVLQIYCLNNKISYVNQIILASYIYDYSTSHTNANWHNDILTQRRNDFKYILSALHNACTYFLKQANL